jgi:hypothetical protein
MELVLVICTELVKVIVLEGVGDLEADALEVAVALAELTGELVLVNVGVPVREYVALTVMVAVLLCVRVAVTWGETVKVGIGTGQFSTNASMAVVGLPVRSNAPLPYPCQL